jgi:hypothetical protein
MQEVEAQGGGVQPITNVVAESRADCLIRSLIPEGMTVLLSDLVPQHRDIFRRVDTNANLVAGDPQNLDRHAERGKYDFVIPTAGQYEHEWVSFPCGPPTCRVTSAISLP